LSRVFEGAQAFHILGIRIRAVSSGHRMLSHTESVPSSKLGGLGTEAFSRTPYRIAGCFQSAARRSMRVDFHHGGLPAAEMRGESITPSSARSYSGR